MIHDLYAELNSGNKSCIIRPRELHSETVSGHFQINFGLGVYGVVPSAAAVVVVVNA
jgi:hypothetical protein